MINGKMRILGLLHSDLFDENLIVSGLVQKSARTARLNSHLKGIVNHP